MGRVSINSVSFSFKSYAEQKLNERKQIDGECWRYARSLNTTFYGQIKIDGKLYLASRLAAHVYLDFDLSSKLYVLHKRTCNHTDCFNPDHLYIGTAKDNAIDRECKRLN